MTVTATITDDSTQVTGAESIGRVASQGGVAFALGRGAGGQAGPREAEEGPQREGR